MILVETTVGSLAAVTVVALPPSHHPPDHEVAHMILINY